MNVDAKAAQVVETPAPPAGSITAALFSEIMRDAHSYARGIEQYRPTRVERRERLVRRLFAVGREYARDLTERTAARIGFSHRHFDPAVAASRLERVLALSEGLEATSALFGDELSRRALLDVLKLRVLGPYHAPLRTTPSAYRAKQAYADRKLRLRRATFDVSDPWFTPLSLYRAPVDGGPPVRLHSHSVDIVSVFLLNQYTYSRGSNRVGVEPGDVVLDVGGCWGDTALYFASLVGPKGRVYTFEFDPESLDVLRANLELNPELASRIEVVERALWDRSGDTLGFAQAGRMTALLADGGQPSERLVSTITLDDFVEQAGIERLGFVKMDVEGAELNVLQGAQRSLQRFAPRLAIAAYHSDDDLVRIPQAINSLDRGYRLYLDTFSPVEEETVLFAAAT
jgi:FkbM family methyltransferase